MSESNMVNTSLVIMAAGIGSRFGTGIKQLARVDDNDHIIMVVIDIKNIKYILHQNVYIL